MDCSSGSASSTSDPRGARLLDPSLQQQIVAEAESIISRPCCHTLRRAFNLRRNFTSLWRRPSGTVRELDGLRAIAVLWVVMLHTSLTWIGTWSGAECLLHFPNVEQCDIPAEFRALARSPLMQPAIYGDLGVDIFFVLSGYLIGAILFREEAAARRAQDSTADGSTATADGGSSSGGGSRLSCLQTINVRRFLWSRWLRLTPAYLFAMLVFMSVKEQRDACAKWGWAHLLFINNLVGPGLTHQACMIHTWSIAIEFQFYLVSPLLILAMASLHRASGRSALVPLLVPALLAVGSLGARFAWVRWALAQETDEHVTDWSLETIYDKVWTRCCPYLAGMAVAFLAHACPWDKPSHAAAPRCHQRARRACTDLLAAAVLMGIAYYGPGLCTSKILAGRIRTTKEEYDSVHMVLLCVGRAAFGCAVAYVVARSLQAGRGRCLKVVLGCRLWAPVATLSYSAYLLQYIGMLPIVRMVSPPTAGTSVYVTFATFVGTLLCVYVAVFALALVCYLAVEKPMMNLR